MQNPAFGKYIDTHAHLWSEEYLDRLRELGATETDVARNLRAGSSEEDLAHRLSLMDRAGVQYQVLSATPQVPQYGTAQEALAAARQINDLYAALVKRYPDRFLAYGAVPLPHLQEAVAEGERCLTELHFQGIAVNTLLHDGICPLDQEFLPFYRALDKFGTVIYIHPTGAGACSPMVNDKHLEWVVGAPIEDMLAVLRLLKSDIPYTCRNLRFHVAHLGGGIGFQMQRIEDNYEDWNAFRESPRETLARNFYFDGANFLAEALELSVRIFGRERILMGSDFPYFQGDKYVRAAEYIARADLDEETKIAILRENAAALYGLISEARADSAAK